MIELKIHGLISNDLRNDSSALILEETAGDRRLLIVIGGYESRSIYCILKKIKPERPFSHDVFKTYLDNIGDKVKFIIIKRFKNGVFMSDIVFETHSGDTFSVDSRTSDAVALAVRFSAPIYCVESIMEELSLDMFVDAAAENKKNNIVDKSNNESTLSDDELSMMSLKELEDGIKDSVKKEDYARASKYRDERNKRLNQKEHDNIKGHEEKNC